MKNEGSFLKSLISGYLLVGLIAVLAIVVLNIYSQSIFKEYILNSSEDRLEKKTSHVEVVLSEMKENCINISSNTNILAYIKDMGNDEGNGYDKYKIKDLLSTYSKDKYFDVMIYFPEDDYIVSARKSSLSSLNYYMAYLSIEKEGYENFKSNLNSQSGYSVMGSICGSNGEEHIYFSRKSNLRESKVPFTVFVILDTDSMNELIDDTHLESNIVLFNREQELIFSQNKAKIPYNMEFYNEDIELYEIEADNNSYVIQINSFKGIEGYLGSVISVDLFWEKFSQMRIFSLWCVIVFFCAAVIASYINSKRQEKPVIELINDFVKGECNCESEEIKIKEFSMIRDMLFKEYQEKQELYEVVKNTHRDRKKFLLRRLLEGVEVEQLENDNVLHKAGIHFVTNWFVVGMIRTEGEKQRGDLDTFIIGNVFEEIFNLDFTGYLIQFDSDNHIFILNLTNIEDADKISTALEEGKKFLSNIFHLQVTISYSDVHEGLKQIEQAYLEAKHAMEYRYLLGRGSEICYSEIKNRSYVYDENEKVFPMLQAYIKNEKDKSSPEDFIRKLLNISKIERDVSIKTVDNFKMQMIQFVSAMTANLDYSIENRNKCIADLFNQSTLEDFINYLASILESMRQINMEQSVEKDICSHARKYIIDNYNDSQLDVERVATAIGMSSSYLFKTYKSKFGVSVAQDITNIRIKKAKELLQQTGLNINIIAEKTGFSDNIVFSKVFKKIVGITPGEFRKQNFKEEV